jgi:predicted glycogen debranching enzyme
MPGESVSPRRDTREWLEADGLGGYACGTVSGIRTRRYHALLLHASGRPTDRVVLVNGFDAWVETPDGVCSISSQRYTPDVIYPDHGLVPESFELEPWPRWKYRLRSGASLEQELFVRHGHSLMALRWRLIEPAGPARLFVRPFLSGRDHHALHHENPKFRFDPVVAEQRFAWHTYDGVATISVLCNGVYEHQPHWYRSFLYSEEQSRGLDCVEDLGAPGVFAWDLAQGEAVLLLAACESASVFASQPSAMECYEQLRDEEAARRRRMPDALHRAADAYVVQCGSRKTIIAGYPWFSDCGRDTFIAMRGLCLTTGRLDDARDILLAWSDTLSDGMLPNRLANHAPPDFNAVDASLWFVIVAHEFLTLAQRERMRVAPADQKRLTDTALAIVQAYARGTRYGIRMDADGLLAAGQPGVQVTWMDAKVGDWIVTPRVGKPVEVQALWLNALSAVNAHERRWDRTLALAEESLVRRFWNDAGGYLYDVIDCNHEGGTLDASFRPNQILAVGGLPRMVLPLEPARRLVEAVERKLWTPIGLRTLAAGEQGYSPRYEGGAAQRDGAYHQGTVWPWLLGPFVEAWVRVHGATPDVKQVARERFLTPLRAHLQDAGLAHVSEIADAEPPHVPRGCPFQACSLGELLRLERCVLG